MGVSGALVHKILRKDGVRRKPRNKKKCCSFNESKGVRYVHVDVNHLPRIEKQKRYLLVAIERITRRVWVMLVDRKGAKESA